MRLLGFVADYRAFFKKGGIVFSAYINSLYRCKFNIFYKKSVLDAIKNRWLFSNCPHSKKRLV